MPRPTILITMDYEIAGNGTGDVRQHMTKPTEKLMEILAANHAKMTVFFELEEFLAFQEHAALLRKKWGYDPAKEIESQLSDLVQSGHEIALHLHPQWIGAQFDGENFILSPENRCLYDVYKNESEMAAYLNKRAQQLTSLVRKFNPSYKITSFRAGGHALRPEKMTLNILAKMGIKAESSVVTGLFLKNDALDIDYRDAPANLGFWRVADNVCSNAAQGDIIEFPVYTRMEPEYKKFTVNRIKTKFFSTGNPLQSMQNDASRRSIPKSPWGLLGYLREKSALKFDFCHMTSSEMMSFLKSATRQHFPLTMIGHCKEFFNTKELSHFLHIAAKKRDSRFCTMAEAVAMIENGGI